MVQEYFQNSVQLLAIFWPRVRLKKTLWKIHGKVCICARISFYYVLCRVPTCNFLVIRTLLSSFLLQLYTCSYLVGVLALKIISWHFWSNSLKRSYISTFVQKCFTCKIYGIHVSEIKHFKIFSCLQENQLFSKMFSKI